MRRSRRRFWEADPDALETLYTCLDGLTRLLAPFIPFLTDTLWSKLAAGVRADAPDSVHLADWPTPRPDLVDAGLATRMDLVRRVVELGRAARAGSGVRTRQPLARAVVAAPEFAGLSADLRAQIAEELNVATVEAAAADVVDVTVKPNFRTLGRRFGKRTPVIAAAVSAAGRPVDGRLTVEVGGERIELAGDDLIISETPRQGWAVTSESGLSVALDLEITPELRRAGVARDVVRVLQEARKAAGLDITDRVDVRWTADTPQTAQALREHASTVAAEVLAVTFAEGAGPTGQHAGQNTEQGTDEAGQHAPDLGLTFWLRPARGTAGTAG